MSSTVVPSYVHGSIAPTFTAFHDDGSFDPDGQRNLLDFMAQRGGVSAYFVRSGMGQMYTFGMDDARELVAVSCAHMAGRGPVLAGCSGVWDRNYDRRPAPKTYTEQGIALGNFAIDQGAAGVVYTIPEALIPEGPETEAELTQRYFETIAAAVNAPIFIYQPPGTDPKYHMTEQSIARLAEIPNVVGAKASYGDGYYVYRLIRATSSKAFAYIVGFEMIFAMGLYAGARACIGQGTTLNPRVMNAVQARFEAGDREGCLAAQDAVNLLVEGGNNPQDFYKRYATENGFPVGRHHRVMLNSPYAISPKLLSDAEYQSFKRLLEETEARILT
jgi:4-hydroxy-tetrahydrodipicolinate synthase